MKAEYVDHLGDDLRVVNAARVSFDKQAEIFGVKDGRLIDYLATHNHWTPFGHCAVTLRETVPIFVARQRFKHTVGFVYNEVSRRYVSDKPEFFFPDGWRPRAEDKKQGSKDEILYDSDRLMMEYSNFCDAAEVFYQRLLACSVAPEQARMILPQSMYTSYYVTGSLYAWANAYKLRSDSHAQKEIQDLASQWDTIISPLFQHSWPALIKV